MKNVINEVMTFTEAAKELGKSKSYITEQIDRGRIEENVDYRCAGRVKLIKLEAVERLKERNKF